MQGRARKSLAVGAALLALAAFASPDRRASIRILTHDPADIAPARAQAVVDLGLVAVSVLVTWSRRLAH